MTVTNVTPHPVRVFGFEVPDRFELGEHPPIVTYPPSGVVARIGEVELGGSWVDGDRVQVSYVEYSHVTGLPKPADGVLLVVSLALALAVPARYDLLVPFREVRDPAGTVIGCRTLARPV